MKLVKRILESQKNRLPMSRIRLEESVRKLVAELKLEKVENQEKLIELFLQRHPDITQRIPETMTVILV